MSFLSRLNIKLGSGKLKSREILDVLYSAVISIDFDELLGGMLPIILKNTGSIGGAFYQANNATGKLEIKYSLGFSKTIYNEFDLNIGEGLIGAAAQSASVSVVVDIPDDSVFVIKTFLGKIKPKSVMLVPIVENENLLGVLALAGLHGYGKADCRRIDMLRRYIASAVSNCIAYERSKRLTAELQFQNELIHEMNNGLELQMEENNKIINMVLGCFEDIAAYVVDRDGRITFCNAACESFFGARAETMFNADAADYFAGGSDSKSSIYRHKMDCAVKYGRYTEKGLREKADGTQYYADISIIPIYAPADRLLGLACITKDVSQQKAVMDELHLFRNLSRKFMDNVETAIIITNEKYIVEAANRKACGVLLEDGLEEGLEELSFCSLFSDEYGVRDFLGKAGEKEQKVFLLNGGGAYVTVYSPIRSRTDEKAAKNIIRVEKVTP